MDTSGNIEVVGAGDVPLTRQQQRLREREAHKPVLHGELKSLIVREIVPVAHGVAQAMEENNITIMALANLLIEKGIISLEDVMKSEADVYKKVRGISPAQQESNDAAKEGQVVERLVEPQGQAPRLDDGEESRTNALLEG